MNISNELLKNIDCFINKLNGEIFFRSDEEIFSLFLRKYLEITNNDFNILISSIDGKKYRVTDTIIEKMRVIFNEKVQRKKEKLF